VEKVRKIGSMLLYPVIEDTRTAIEAKSLKPENPEEK